MPFNLGHLIGIPIPFVKFTVQVKIYYPPLEAGDRAATGTALAYWSASQDGLGTVALA